jgi:cupin superfamily acireductone dioxygenase involved in methionine salvage
MTELPISKQQQQQQRQEEERHLTESQEEAKLPEHIKSRPRIIVSKSELEEIQKTRKLKLSDLVKLKPPKSATKGITKLKTLLKKLSNSIS